MVLSNRVTARSVVSAREQLIELWRMTRHQVGDLDGWSRVLENNSKFGIVASSNALEAMHALRADIPDVDSVLASLRAEQMEAGCWPFKATITQVGVVDSTANVLLAYGVFQGQVRSDGRLLESATKASQWLHESQRETGGWGLVRDEGDSPSRPYSTALTLRALAGWDPVDSHRSVENGISFLLSTQSVSGAWRDANGNESIPATSECVRTLAMLSSERRPLGQPIRKACRWLTDMGATTQLWTSKSTPGEFEEVPVNQAGSKQRVDYIFSARAAAVTALVEADTEDRTTISAAEKMLTSTISNDWEPYARGRFYERPPSWMLYDVSMAVARVETLLLKGDDEIWAGLFRVVRSPRSRPWLVRRFIERYPTVIVGGILFGAILPLTSNWGTVLAGAASLLGAVLVTIAADAASHGVFAGWSRVRLRLRGKS